MKPIALSALLALALPGGAIAEDYAPCVENTLLVGACWNVRGRVSLHNGNPSVRIWPVGSKRLLGVRDADPPLLPPHLRETLSWDQYVFADLKVCPMTRASEGKMQIVCVAGARNGVARDK